MIQVKKEEIIPYQIDKVWNLVTNLEDVSWRSDLSKIEKTDETHFVEYDHHEFATYFTITRKENFQQYEFEIENQNLKGHWVGKFEAVGEDQTKLILMEEIEIQSFIMKLLAKPYLKRQQKRYIKDLIKELKGEKN